MDKKYESKTVHIRLPRELYDFLSEEGRKWGIVFPGTHIRNVLLQYMKNKKDKGG